MVRLLALSSLVLGGCIFNFGGGGKACDTMAAGSVAVSVSAWDGGDVSAALVTFSADGADFMPCDGFAGDGEYTCGWEVAGPITVRVEADGYTHAEETVVIEQDECHVIPQHLEIVLSDIDVDCTTEVVPSVAVSVVGSSGEELNDVAVSWGYRDADMAPQACEGAGADWICGEEVAGDLEIYAVAGGHAGEMVEVHVDADECHVITEYVELALDWLPD